MKTVRLPIFENDMETGEILEVDLAFFLPPSRLGMISQARVIMPMGKLLESMPRFEPDPIQEPLADWEKELLGIKDEVGLYDVPSKHPEEVNEVPLQDQWRDLEGIPTSFFEINGFGAIRHKGTGKIMDLTMHPEKLVPAVKLIINRELWWIEGPALAAKMWAKQ